MIRPIAEISTDPLRLKWLIQANEVLLKAVQVASRDERHASRLREIEMEQSLLRVHLELHNDYQLLSKQFDPDQTRVPAGNPDGGQWTDGMGTSNGSGNGREWLAQNPRPTEKPSFFQSAAGAVAGLAHDAPRIVGAVDREMGPVIRKLPIIGSTATLLSALREPEIEYRLDEALRQYNAIAAADDPDVVPILGLRAKQFIRDEDKADGKLWASVREVDKETIKKFCPEYLNVQTLADDVAFSMGPVSLYGSASNYGTQYHLRAAAEVMKIWKGRLIPELYLMKPMEGKPDEYYARDKIPARAKDTLGLDVVEPVDNETACVYDFKTGVEGLTPKRMSDFAFSSAKSEKLQNFKQYFFIEIRPSASSIKRD